MLLVTHLYGCSKINLQLWGSSYLSNHSSWWILKFYVENLVTLGQIFELIECCCVYFEIKISFSVVLYLFRCLVPTRTLQLIIMVCSKLWSFDNSCFLWFEDWLFVTRTHLLFFEGARTAQSIIDSGLSAVKSMVNQRLSGGGRSGSGRGGGKQVFY